VLIREYNQAIDSSSSRTGCRSGPIHTYFAAHPEQMSDRLHERRRLPGDGGSVEDALLAPA
jgi:hypothetical protein